MAVAPETPPVATPPAATPPVDTPPAPPATPPVTPPAPPATPPVTPPETPPTGAVALWGDKWREELAGDDPALLTRLQRMSDPKVMAQAIREQDKLIASGKLRSALPENATPEQIMQFRKENNLPETPEAYELQLPEGIVIGDADKPMIRSVQVAAHASFAPPAVVNQIVEAYYKQVEVETQAEIARQRSIKDATTAELQALWGDNFPAMRNLVVNLLESAPVEVKDNLMYGETADGTLICNHAPTLRWLADLAMKINPAALILPNSSGGQLQTIEAEILDLEKQMENYHSWQSNKVGQARLLKLYEARTAFAAKVKPNA